MKKGRDGAVEPPIGNTYIIENPLASFANQRCTYHRGQRTRLDKRLTMSRSPGQVIQCLWLSIISLHVRTYTDPGVSV
jgi:hypothetical protein